MSIAKTERDARLRADFSAGMALPELIEKYGISKQRIYQACQGCERADQRHLRKGKVLREVTVSASDRAAYQSRKVSLTTLAAKYRCAFRVIKRCLDAEARAPRKHVQMYEMFKGGATIPQVAAAFGVSKTYVGVAIVRARKKDPNPHYRRRRK